MPTLESLHMSVLYKPLTNLYNLMSKVVNVGDLPPEFDIQFYRLVHADLSAIFNDAQLLEHYEHFGRDEGRISSPAAHRAGLIATISPHADILEIGPFTTPVFRGPNVKYFDVLDKEGLLERASQHGRPTGDCPEIDFVSPVGDLNVIDTMFDTIFSSHCLEHQPDLIKHLQQVEKVLKNGGRYCLIIPDKRYCFDYFIDTSSLDEILRAHEERRTIHTVKSVFEHAALTTHSDPIRHWQGFHDDPHLGERAARAHHAVSLFHESRGRYIDVHAWQFTPSSFRSLITELGVRGLSKFRAERVYDTVFGEPEFTAVLSLVS